MQKSALSVPSQGTYIRDLPRRKLDIVPSEGTYIGNLPRRKLDIMFIRTVPDIPSFTFLIHLSRYRSGVSSDFLGIRTGETNDRDTVSLCLTTTFRSRP